ncbi:MAG: glutamine-hydrolyzing GMP synthase, partial [Bdellovibrionia bacterium]
MAHTYQTVVILDYGSQYTQLIARRIRELGIYSVILPGDAKLERIEGYSPKAVILSGGPNSVYEEGAPTLPAGFLTKQESAKLPTLGICYGMQLLAKDLGGRVEKGDTREYGRMEVIGDCGKRFFAWMSHGDEVKEVPPGFDCASKSAQGKVASMFNDDRKIYGLQFHPEVTHTENGIEFLKEFLLKQANIQPDWNMGSVLDE